jgi:SEC-C motif
MSATAQSEEQESAWSSTIESLCSATGNFVRPEEESAWKNLNTSFWDDLAPSGPVEAFLLTEIVRAAWRIRRCNSVEASLIHRLSDPALDPMEDPATIKTQSAVDRARSLAEHSFERSIAELRRIQTERQFRNEAFPQGTNLTKCGIAGYRQILPAIGRKAPNPFKTKITSFKEAMEQSEAELKAALGFKDEAKKEDAEEISGTPRNAPCPCGSGQKHKRCCGKDAPPVLGEPASLAA